MPRIDAAIDIKAPQDKVFAYIADVTAQPEWCKWAKRVEVTSPGRIGIGATDEMVMQIGLKKERVEAIVTEYAEGQFYSRRNTRGMEMLESFAIEPTGDGAKVAWTIEYMPPMGAMGKFMNFLFMETLFQQLQEDSLTNLKQRLETAR